MNGLKPRARGQQALEAENTDIEDDAKVAIYARTSSSSQRFGYSIDQQVERCWEQCEAAEWSVSYVFVDEAESGRDMERPKFQTMLETARQGDIDVVMFWKLDRFCRSLADLVRTEEQLNQWGVALQSVTEYIDTTTPVGRFNFRNLASAAELESDLTSSRAKMGMYGLAQNRKWPNDHPPLGYHKAPEETLRVNENEAVLVRRIFRLYLKERSMPQVAFLLNEEGLQTKKGTDWSRQAIRRILTNELYIGAYQLAGYQEQVESYRIVGDDLFTTVKEVRYRFKHSGDEMNNQRKRSKAERILSQYKQVKGEDQ
jgi:site-specific DNA recombinase